jgi:hypothetical protein
MSELTFNANGEPFDWPHDVTDARVRRMKIRGAPELVYGRDGRPAVVAASATIDELREAVGGVAGKYRLDPLNADGRLVEGAPAAYVQIVPVQPDAMLAPSAAPAVAVSETESVLRDAIRSNTELARTVISTFPQMMESAARLIEAADGAGIPRRRPLPLEYGDDDQDQSDESDDDRPEAPAAARAAGGFDINALVAQVVPVVVMGIMNGKFDLSRLGEMLDWRKAAAAGAKKSAESATPNAPRGRATAAAPRATTNESRTRPTPRPSAPVAEPAADDAPLAPLDPAAMGHFLAIQSALTPDEAALAREVASTLSPRELRAWLAELGPLSVPDAVAVIRHHIGAPAGAAASEGVS